MTDQQLQLIYNCYEANTSGSLDDWQCVCERALCRMSADEALDTMQERFKQDPSAHNFCLLSGAMAMYQYDKTSQ